MTAATAKGMPLFKWRYAAILLALAVQILAAAFFVVDSLYELNFDENKRHALAEFPVAIALCLGAIFTIRGLRDMALHASRQERAMAVARGVFTQFVDTELDKWRLTIAEREVAWLLIKGVEMADIAKMRGSAQGTVRAQLAHVYSKSGVTSRAQFVSLFVAELLERSPDQYGQFHR